MTMTNVISLAERRIERAKARHVIGTCAAAIAVEADKMTPAALSRWHLMQEAIDEFLLSGQQFHIGDIVNQVNEWEKMLNNGKA